MLAGSLRNDATAQEALYNRFGPKDAGVCIPFLPVTGRCGGYAPGSLYQDLYTQLQVQGTKVRWKAGSGASSYTLHQYHQKKQEVFQKQDIVHANSLIIQEDFILYHAGQTGCGVHQAVTHRIQDTEPLCH